MRYCRKTFAHLAGLIGAFLILSACRQDSEISVSLLPQAPTTNLVAFYEGHDLGSGNTSIAHDAEDIYKWSGSSPHKAESWGYFTPDGREIPYIKRDRDLGQTFTCTGEAVKRLTAITVCTGPGSNVVRPGTYGKNISLQLFEVSGIPTIHDNGSDSTVEAWHGSSHNRPGDSILSIRDDYMTGEVYTSLAVFSGATFPTKRDFGFDQNENVSPDHPNLKGKFLRFALPDDSNIMLEPGKAYAFLVMLDQMGVECGFTLANHYFGKYPGGHGIRRDGNGLFPPVPADPSKHFKDPANAEAFASAHFPTDLSKRTSIPPGTNGYPDVDTWRDLQFYIEAQ